MENHLSFISGDLSATAPHHQDRKAVLFAPDVLDPKQEPHTPDGLDPREEVGGILGCGGIDERGNVQCCYRAISHCQRCRCGQLFLSPLACSRDPNQNCTKLTLKFLTAPHPHGTVSGKVTVHSSHTLASARALLSEPFDASRSTIHSDERSMLSRKLLRGASAGAGRAGADGSSMLQKTGGEVARAMEGPGAANRRRPLGAGVKSQPRAGAEAGLRPAQHPSLLAAGGSSDLRGVAHAHGSLAHAHGSSQADEAFEYLLSDISHRSAIVSA
eukprot:2094957-Rhodomonas_salina.2